MSEIISQFVSARDATSPPETAREPDLLRIATAGNVDDGKSTLLGRLLYETGSIPDDQLAAVEQASRRRGEPRTNLALLTDGLSAEREQNITIDVAYRYFSTPRRRFIVADTPGHVQYTRNMVTGASTADLALLLVDAREGVLAQTRRHAFITAMLRVRRLLVAVNKMDLVGYRRDAFERIIAQYHELEELELGEVTLIPVSALHGDNVVAPSRHMGWYEGNTLLHHLETVEVGGDGVAVGFRFPVQYVIRSEGNFRGLAGRIAAGTVRVGDEVAVLPSARGASIRSIQIAGAAIPEAAAGDSVVLTLDQELDAGRGDLLVRRDAMPCVGDRFDAMVCWLDDERPLEPGLRFLLRHTTRTVQASVQEVVHRANVETLRREPAQRLEGNDVGAVRIITREALFFDPYVASRAMGSFILIDPFSNATVAAGTILNDAPEAQPAATTVSPDVVWESWNVPRQLRESRQGHRAAVVWLTGLPGAGKTTLARVLERELFALGCQTMLLDGDQLRHGLCGDLGFTEEARRENVRRVGEVARLFFEQGSIVLVALVSPFAEDRRRARARVPEGRFFEVHVDADPQTCRQRDPKGLYAKADRGEIPDLTGISSRYEAPDRPEAVAQTETEEPHEVVERLMLMLRRAAILGGGTRKPSSADNRLRIPEITERDSAR